MRKREIEREQNNLWRQFLVIVGMAHPQIASAFEPGWTGALPAIAEDEFDAKPVKVPDAA